MTANASARRGKGAAAASLTVEQLPIDDLHPDPLNPRRIEEAARAALTRSIETFGVVDSVLARRGDRRVIAGHQRLIAARPCGLPTVPVTLLDLAAEDARLLNVALNRIGGEWDADLLARLLIDLHATADRCRADLAQLIDRIKLDPPIVLTEPSDADVADVAAIAARCRPEEGSDDAAW